MVIRRPGGIRMVLDPTGERPSMDGRASSTAAFFDGGLLRSLDHERGSGVPQLDRQPHARAVLEPALAPGGHPSHAYLFYGPGGSGKRSVARAMAAELLAEGSNDPGGARARVDSGAHPDLTW